MTRKFIMVISDAHLAPILEDDRMPYRGRAFAPDEELSHTIDRAVQIARQAGGALEIVLGGDVFDLDVPATSEEVHLCAHTIDPRTSSGGAAVLGRTLADHPAFTLALRRAIAAGARVVVLPGNHDAQLALSSPREVLRRALDTPPGARALVFKSWCHITDDGLVLVEHGHQYDPLCRVHRLVLGREAAEETVGTVSSFYAPLLFPHLDPFAVDPFAERRGVVASLKDALRVGGARGLLFCARDLLAATVDRPATTSAAELAAEIDADPQIVGLRQQLFASKATGEELLHAALGSVDYMQSVEAAMLRAMVTATDAHGAKVAVVGHTHAPGQMRLPNGATLLNSGSWTPRRDRQQPVGSFAWIVTNGPHVVDAVVQPVLRGQP